MALFGADTVYGLATEPDSREGVERLYRLKGRRPDKPAALMFFALELALAALPELPARTRGALERLLPGARDAAAAQPRPPLPAGVRPGAADARPARAAPRGSSSPRWRRCAGPCSSRAPTAPASADARRLEDVDERVRAGVDLVLDAGELPGTASTVIDLTGYHEDGRFAIVREGALPAESVREALVRSSR